MNLRDPNELLDALDPEQCRVARQVSGPLAVLAGAGTGKTRAITYRIAYGVASGAFDPLNVLAVTFTKRAAGEMRQRLRALGVPTVQARTFHAAALSQLNFFWPAVVGGSIPAIVSKKASLVSAAALRVGIKADRTTVRDLAAEIEWAKVSMLDAGAYIDCVMHGHRIPPAGLTADKFSRVLDAYEGAKKDRDAIDFEDVLLLMCGILLDNDAVARRVRSQYTSFVVDEYQDVSSLQQRLLDLWVGDRHDICVVGDAAQTIYSFAGATSQYLLHFSERHRGANIVELNRDYRSTPQIVSVANRLMENSTTSEENLPDSGRKGGRGAQGTSTMSHNAVHLISQRPSGAAMTYVTYETEETEAEGVAAAAQALHKKGVPFEKMAVLYRTNSQSGAFEAAFSRAGISSVMHGGQRFFEREEIQKAYVILRRMAVTFSDRNMVQHDTVPSRNNVDEGTQSAEELSNVHAPSAEQNESALIHQVREVARMLGWDERAPETTGALRERWDNLNALVDLAVARPSATLSEFVAELRERKEHELAPVLKGVTLSSIHAAKGLEWDAVFLIGVSEGLLPISLAHTLEAREEEKRLLYVAITRARDYLQISWARSKSLEDGRRPRKRSHFLDSIWPTADSLPKMSGKQRAYSRSHMTEKKKIKKTTHAEFLQTQNPQVILLFESLREWRASIAEEKSKPAFTIFTDQSLRDIAIAQPKTMRQLSVIRGVGAIKLKSYGPKVLEIIRETLTGEESAH